MTAGSLTAGDDVTPNFGSSSGTPCTTGSPSAVLNLNPCAPGGLPAGRYTPTASASNPADMVSSTSGATIEVECSGPLVSVDSTEGLSKWYSGPQTVEVNASDESGLQGDISCTVGPDGDTQTVTISPSQLPYLLPVSGDGVNAVSCTAENNVDYSTTSSLSGNVLIDDQTPTVSFDGASSAPAWVSGSRPSR